MCVINYKFWQRHFQGDPNIAVGKTIKINGHPLTIVGVAPDGFIGARLFSFIPEVWVPVMMDQTLFPNTPELIDPQARNNRWLTPWGRLKPGLSRRQAEAALNVVERRLGAAISANRRRT